MSLRELYRPKPSEYQRGYAHGKAAIISCGYQDALDQHERCSDYPPDDYDKGFSAALRDHNEFQAANVKAVGNKDPDD